MKTLCTRVRYALVLFACSLSAQTTIAGFVGDPLTPPSTLGGSSSIGSWTIGSVPNPPLKDAPFLVEYTTDEPCFECGVRYAIACSGPPTNTVDCGIPRKIVQHFEPFESEAKALKFMNEAMAGKFARLLRVTSLPVNTVIHTTEIPQPPKKIETTEYVVGKREK